MAKLKIVKYGEDDILRKVSREVETITPRILTLLDDMIDTMHEANGCGLAASQIGILRRYCIIDVGDGIIELVNPVILEEKGVQEEDEGCLSFPGEYGVTRRPMYVKVKAQDRNGNHFIVEGEGLKARALCHEIDHLNGVTYKDRLINKVVR
jgi:peptide deformylase